MYTANKVVFLKKHGWNVHVVPSKEKGEVLIPVLKEYKENLITDIGFAACFYPMWLKNRVFKKIKKLCDGSDEVILESQIISSSFFIEEIAEYLGARHIINTLDEQIPVSIKGQKAFFEYKLMRWEFQNAGEWRLRQIFGKNFKEEYIAFENQMVYSCDNVVSEDDVEYSFENADYTIVSIGRLDKPYIIPMTEEIKNFADNNSNKSINVIYVGGSFSGSFEDDIQSILSPVENLNCYILGYLYPVPKSIIRIADVAIACANSVNVTADRDVPTIVVDMNDHMAVGVYGYDTFNRFARTTEPRIGISAYLQSVLIDKRFIPKGLEFADHRNINTAFEKELSFIVKSKGNVGYYDVLCAYSKLEKLRNTVKYLCIRFFGSKIVEKYSGFRNWKNEKQGVL